MKKNDYFSKCFLLGFLLLSLFSTKLYGQMKISGIVLDNDSGDGLAGATIVAEGTRKGTTSSDDGTFSISNVTIDDTLQISLVGYQNREVPLAGGMSGPIRIRLMKSSTSLKELVVISYGMSTKEDVTGSISTIDGSSVKDVPATKIGQKLQGKVAGVQISDRTGRPGGGMQFRIRGAASFSGGFQPLIVVDGQPIVGENSENGGIGFLDPNDIQSVSVLKDAAASALYGSRASNGVILITTKHANKGQTNVRLNVYTAWQKVPQKGRPNIMNARQFGTFMHNFYEDKIKYEGRSDSIPEVYRNPSQYGKGTDWYDAILRTAPQQNYSVSFNSGTGKVLSANTITYMNQDGVLLNTGFKRYSLRSNNEYVPNEYLKFGINIAPSYQIRHNATTGLEGSRQVIGTAQIASPLEPIYHKDGSFNSNIESPGMLGVANPVQQLMIRNRKVKNFRLLGNVYGQVELIPGLTFKSSLNIDMGSKNDNYFRGTYYYSGFNPNLPNNPSGNKAYNSSNNYVSWTNENTLTYDFNINKHSFNVLVGHSAQKWQLDKRSINGSNFAGNEIPWIVGATSTKGSSDYAAWTMASLFGRIRYNFDHRYFLMGSFRRDGSSRFGLDNKYGTFPSVSLGWVLSNEKFFPNTDILNFVKLRGSWGKTGNFNIGNYASISKITSQNYVFGGSTVPGLAITNLGNPILTWEKAKETDIGIDLNLLNDRITFSYDYYNKITTGMLFATSIPYSSGYNKIEANVGKLRNWGHEFQIHSENLVGELSWSTDFNISFNKNVVKELPPNTPFIGQNGRYGETNRSEIGKPLAQFYGYVFEGIYMTQDEVDNDPSSESDGSTIGTAKMKDVNGDGKITPDDRTLIGDPNPDFIFGMTNTFSYKNFDLNIIVSGQYGNDIINMLDEDLLNIDGVFNMRKDMLNVWRSPENPGNGKTPRTLSGTTEIIRVPNTLWIEDGSYLTIKNVTLGYRLNLNKVSFMRSVRIYFGIQDLYTWTSFQGQNPEASLSRNNSVTEYGQVRSAYPIPRTFTLGVNINF